MEISIQEFFQTNYYFKEGSRLKFFKIYSDFLEYLKTQNFTSDCYTYKQFQRGFGLSYRKNHKYDDQKDLQKIYLQNKEQEDTFKSHLIKKRNSLNVKTI